MRCASRDGRILRVKLALLSRACFERGGRPCLQRSESVSGWSGEAARRAMSLSVTVDVWIARVLGVNTSLRAAKRVPLCLAAARSVSITGLLAQK